MAGDQGPHSSGAPNDDWDVRFQRQMADMSRDLASKAVTDREFEEAQAKGIESYVGMRSAGLSHADVLAAWQEGLRVHGGELMQYAAARAEGATHERVIAAYRRGIDPGTYSLALMGRATDEELYAAQAAGVDLFDYTEVRIYGAPHEDAMRAHDAGVVLRAYAVGREDGHDHEAAVAYARAHGNKWR